MIDKGHLNVNAEARANFLVEVELSDLGQCPGEICIHTTVTGYREHTGPLVVRTTAVWLLSSRGNTREFRARELGFAHNAPAVDDEGESNESY